MKKPSGSRGRLVLTGGTGYLGSCAAEVFAAAGYEPVLLDDYSSSAADAQRPYETHVLDLKEREATLALFRKLQPVVGVVHFAAHTLVSESVAQPGRYLRNNFLAALHVAEAATATKVGALVHSSTCAVYGAPSRVPIDENCVLAPISPYGQSKVAAEQAFLGFRKSAGLPMVNLRYFNPAGATASSRYGEAHEPETHLIPLVVAALQAKKPIRLFGEDYPTADGTCVRDFIHVEDLLQAHLLALEKLLHDAKSAPEAVNVGTGRGSSVREVAETAARVLGAKLTLTIEPRRPGDPPALVADNALLRSWLQWTPTRTLESMIESHARFVASRKSR